MSKSLENVAKGTILAFAGVFIFTFFEFLTRLMIARWGTTDDYGSFSLGIAFLNSFVLISSMGLPLGATRCIAYYKGKQNYQRVGEIIRASLQVSIIVSLFLFLILFLSSDLLMRIFHLQQSTIFKVFSIAIPFFVSIEILSSIFRGFNSVKEKVYFRDFLMSFLRIVFMVIVIVAGLPFINMIYAYTLSIVITSMVFIIYTYRKEVSRFLKITAEIKKTRTKLLRFSLPLLTTSMLALILSWSDTMILGYFRTPDIVGLYNAAHPIASIIPMMLTSMILIYSPITAELYSRNQIDEIRKNYIILTKWVVFATFPLFILIFIFPENILNILFGANYVTASIALRILALGMLFHVIFGPNGTTLVVIGRTRLFMMDNVVCIILDILLNIYLIPKFGIAGAAIATAISLFSINILMSLQIFYIHRIHPFSRNYFKPLLASIIPTYIIYFISKTLLFEKNSIWFLIILYILFLAGFLICLAITGSFDEHDKSTFRLLKERLNRGKNHI